MKILLVMPDARIHRLRLGGFRMSFREAPLTLTTLAALVPARLGAELRLADESVEDVPLHEAFDLVGISCLTGTAPRAYALADHFRARGAAVVLGGVHVTLRPDEAAAHADAIVIGFAERAWPRLLADWSVGRLAPKYVGEGVPLGGLPAPRRDLQRRRRYAVPNTVFATRGCRGTCDFCTVPTAGFGWHTRPVEDVVREIESLPPGYLAFNDVSLNEDPLYARALFRALAPLKRSWGGLATARIADDPELLDLMAASGCVYLLIGLESVNRRALAGMGKAFNRAERYGRMAGLLRERGIALQGCFIFGLDEDTPEVFDETVHAVNALRIDIPRYAIYTPYPGTRAFTRLKAEGRLLHENWRFYDTQHAVFRPAGMSADELEDGLRHAYERTYSLRSILHRTAGSPRLPVTLTGNLAYRLYIRRLRSEAKARRRADGVPGWLEDAPAV